MHLSVSVQCRAHSWCSINNVCIGLVRSDYSSSAAAVKHLFVIRGEHYHFYWSVL